MEIVVIKRVYELEQGQRFLYSGRWRYVVKIEDGKVYFTTVLKGNKISKQHRLASISHNSQLWVESREEIEETTTQS